MGQALIRNIDDELLDDYRQAAKANRRSLEAELREALLRARPLSPGRTREVLERLAKVREASAGRPQTPSEVLLRRLRDGDDE